MQITKYFCDICGIECFTKDGIGTFAGFLVKLDKELNSQKVGFEGHYCAVCAEEILKFISELKNAEHTDTSTVGK